MELNKILLHDHINTLPKNFAFISHHEAHLNSPFHEMS